MEIFMIIAPIAAILALGYALIAAFGVKKAPEGTDKMKEIAASIRKGASAYLKRQYKTVEKINSLEAETSNCLMLNLKAKPTNSNNA